MAKNKHYDKNFFKQKLLRIQFYTIRSVSAQVYPSSQGELGDSHPALLLRKIDIMHPLAFSYEIDSLAPISRTISQKYRDTEIVARR